MVEKLLEDTLDDTDSWVNATTSDTGGNLNCSEKSHSNCKTIDWHILRSVVLGNLENESNKESSHEGLNE